MRDAAKLPREALIDLFKATADQIGLVPAIVEKDFWVCVMLDYLFGRSPWKTRLAFKGGTSLSKAFGLIKRFSEDIDLILDWRLWGYGKDEPWEERSNTQQDLFNARANELSAAFLKNEFVPRVKADLEAELGREIALEMDAHVLGEGDDSSSGGDEDAGARSDSVEIFAALLRFVVHDRGGNEG